VTLGGFRRVSWRQRLHNAGATYLFLFLARPDDADRHAGLYVPLPFRLYLFLTIPDRPHRHTRLTALCPGLPGWAGTRKVKPIWILLKQETVSGSGTSWVMCKSAPRSRQITTPAPHHSVFYRPDALPAAQPTASDQLSQNVPDRSSPNFTSPGYSVGGNGDATARCRYFGSLFIAKFH